MQPETGALWVSVNERDTLGDDLVPDYITSVKDGAFYGWPYSYIGNHYDPEHQQPAHRQTAVGPNPDTCHDERMVTLLIKLHLVAENYDVADGQQGRYQHA